MQSNSTGAARWIEGFDEHREKYSRGSAEYGPSLAPLILDNLVVRRGDFTLGPINLQIPARSVVALAGPSGSGKSSLLRGISGLDTVSDGTVWLGSRELTHLDPSERRVGFVFQEAVLIPNMNARENIVFPLKIRRVDKDTQSEKLGGVVEELEYDRRYLGMYEEQLPAGIRRLTTIGREHMHTVELFLLDEPMGHLDAHLRRAVRRVVSRVVHSMGKTTLLALNEAEEIMALCDYVLVLDSGKAVEFGETGELYAHPKTMAGMETLSPLGVNSIEVEVRKERTIPFDLSASGVADGSYLLCFRPHEVRPGTERDIPVRQVRRSLYDSNTDLVSAECSEQKPSVTEEAAHLITILLPREQKTVSHIRPLNHFLFPVDSGSR